MLWLGSAQLSSAQLDSTRFDMIQLDYVLKITCSLSLALCKPKRYKVYSDGFGKCGRKFCRKFSIEPLCASVCIKLLFVLEIPIISYAVTLMYLICYLLERVKKIILDLLSINANSSDTKKKQIERKKHEKHPANTQWNRNADKTHLIPDKMNETEPDTTFVPPPLSLSPA